MGSEHSYSSHYHKVNIANSSPELNLTLQSSRSGTAGEVQVRKRSGWLGKSKKSRVNYGCGHLGESQIFLVLIISILYNTLAMFDRYYSLLCFNLFEFLCNPTGQVLIVESLTFNSTCTPNSNLFDGKICV